MRWTHSLHPSGILKSTIWNFRIVDPLPALECYIYLYTCYLYVTITGTPGVAPGSSDRQSEILSDVLSSQCIWSDLNQWSLACKASALPDFATDAQCNHRELNPDRIHGKDSCYHYTTVAKNLSALFVTERFYQHLITDSYITTGAWNCYVH